MQIVTLKLGPGINANGPAIKGGCVTRRKHRVGSWYFSRKVVTVQGGYGTCFCRPGTNFIEHYELLAMSEHSERHGVAVQGSEVTRKLSRYRILIKSNGAVTVMSPYTVLSWEQERFAKTVTSLITFSTYDKSIVSGTLPK